MPAPVRIPPVHQHTSLADLPLFSEPARARRTDPGTSKDAARRVDTATLQARALRVLRNHPTGLTTHELAEKMGESLVTVSPRMKRLEEKQLVVRGPKVAGRTVWRAVDAA